MRNRTDDKNKTRTMEKEEKDITNGNCSQEKSS